MAADPATFAWIHDPTLTSLTEAGCISAAVGATLPIAMAAFGADPERPVAIDEDLLAELPPAVAFTEIEGGVIAVEFNGYQGSRAEIVRPLSKAGKAASMYWSVNGANRFTCARRGRVLAATDVMVPEGVDSVPASVRKLLTRTGNDESDWLSIGLAMVQTFTGLAIALEVVSSGLQTAYRLHPPLEYLHTETPQLAPLQYVDRELLNMIVTSSISAQRAVAEMIAITLVRDAGLEQHPAVRSVTDNFGRTEPAAFTYAATELLITLNQEWVIADAQDPWWLTEADGPGPELARVGKLHLAVRMLRYATHDDAFTAAAITATHASHEQRARAMQLLEAARGEPPRDV